MSARIYIRQNGITYKFLRIEQQSDGSIYLTVLRDDERQDGAMKWDQEKACFVPNPGATRGTRRISYHVSGRVNYHSLITSPPLFFDPLFDIKQHNHFLLISVPCVARLSPADIVPAENSNIPTAIIDINVTVKGRMTFGFTIAPLDDDCKELGPYLRLGYDTFALFVCQEKLPMPLTDDMTQHFIYAAPKGLRDTQFCGRFEAELAYHQKRNGPGVIVYGPNKDGVYTLYPKVVMRITPRAKFEFFDPTLVAEIVEGSRPNRIRFRVRGRGGYITDRDLRPLVRLIELDAEL